MATHRRGRCASLIEADVSWAGMTGGDGTSNINIRLRGFQLAYVTTPPPEATDWSNFGSDHMGIIDGDVGAVGNPLIYTGNTVLSGSRVVQFVKSLGSGLGAILKLDPKVAYGIQRAAGTAYTGGTITIGRVALWTMAEN
jgi:hypothetical protein